MPQAEESVSTSPEAAADASAEKKISIALADDHTIFRDASTEKKISIALADGCGDCYLSSRTSKS